MGAAQGFGAIAVSVLFWGSNFVPVKEFPTGDGMLYQWVMAVGIYCVGLIVNIIRGNPTFQPFAMLGGFFWATGNVMTVTIVRLIGLGLGSLIWGISSLMGWMSGNFGLFGLKAQSVKVPALNYIGVLLTIIGAVCFAFINPTVEKSHHESENNKSESPTAAVKLEEHSNESNSHLDTSASISVEDFHEISKESPKNGTKSPIQPWRRSMLDYLHMEEHHNMKHKMMHFFHLDHILSHKNSHEIHAGSDRHCLPITFKDIDSYPPIFRRILGLLLAVVAGILYGVNFNPPQYLIDHNDGTRSNQGIDYAFSHFSGILLSSTAYFVLYSILKRNNPEMHPQIVLPSFLSGIMWGIAQTCFFIANTNLGMVITYPICSTGPGVIVALWSIFLFKEISGKRNFILLGISFFFVMIAVTLITLSQIL